MIIYFLTATTFFSILLTLAKKQQFIYLTDFKYTQKLNIFFVIFFVFLFLIFAGLPPTIGFYLKFISYFFILQQYGISILISIII
jgi:NADH:ubiquinone oxidoreductase subunit 2 (subunit N)